MAYMLRRQEGFRLFLDDGHVDIDSKLVENAIRSPAMNRRNWARFASLIGTCKMNGVEPYAYLHDLFTKLSNGHPPATSMPSCHGQAHSTSPQKYDLIPESLTSSPRRTQKPSPDPCNSKIYGTWPPLRIQSGSQGQI